MLARCDSSLTGVDRVPLLSVSDPNLSSLDWPEYHLNELLSSVTEFNFEFPKGEFEIKLIVIWGIPVVRSDNAEVRPKVFVLLLELICNIDSDVILNIKHHESILGDPYCTILFFLGHSIFIKNNRICFCCLLPVLFSIGLYINCFDFQFKFLNFFLFFSQFVTKPLDLLALHLVQLQFHSL